VSDGCNATWKPSGSNRKPVQCALDAGHSPKMHLALGGAIEWLDGEGDSTPHKAEHETENELERLRSSFKTEKQIRKDAETSLSRALEYLRQANELYGSDTSQIWTEIRSFVKEFE
jgi:hypothetical protein